MAPLQHPSLPPDVASAVRKVYRHLVPLLFLLGLVCLLDRASVGYAALTMKAELGLSAVAYGVGAGVFFLGYFIFEVPSNLIMDRVGPRVWLARIAISWGLVILATAFIQNEASFYAARLLLGIAEAGLFPAVYVLVGRWVPWANRGRVLALFLACNAVSGIIIGPVASGLFAYADVFGLTDWRVLFFLLGLPAIALGIITARKLPDRPQDAPWLTDQEKIALVEIIEREQLANSAAHSSHTWAGLKAAAQNRYVWGFTAVFFLSATVNYGIILFLPQIVQSLAGSSPARSSLLSSIPYIAGLVASILVARSSDRRNERRWHHGASAFVGATGLFATGLLLERPVLAIITLSIAVGGMFAGGALQMTRPTLLLTGTAAAAGLAIINSVGSIGGFIGPYIVGWLQSTSGTYLGGLFYLSGMLIACGVVTICIRIPSERRNREHNHPAPEYKYGPSMTGKLVGIKSFDKKAEE